MQKLKMQRTKCEDCGRFQVVDEEGNITGGFHEPETCPKTNITVVETFWV